MKFSVIIPLYNKAPHIRSTIDSVRSQTFQDFEIIIIDDGSTDDSVKIVNSLRYSKINLYQQRNSGVSAARNLGIEIAKADNIAFLDADDLWLPDHLETINQLLHLYPDCGLYASSYTVIHDDQIDIQQIKKGFDKPDYLHWKLDLDGYLDVAMGEGAAICTDTVCIPREIIDQTGGFKNNLSHGEDLEFWLRIAANYPVAVTNKVTALYNFNSVNRFAHRFEPFIDTGLKTLAAMVNDGSFSNTTRKKLYEYYARRLIGFGQKSLQFGHLSIARYCIKHSYKTRKYRKNLLVLLFKFFTTWFSQNILKRTFLSSVLTC